MGAPNRHVLNVTRFTAALEAMLEAPTSRKELVRITGLHENTVHKMVRAMHGRTIYVANWAADHRGAMTVAEFQVGKKRDAKKPLPQDERSRKARRQAKKDWVAKPSIFSDYAVAIDPPAGEHGLIL